MKYNPDIVLAFWREYKVPKPLLEYTFHPTRKWRFDFAFPQHGLAIEVQGGLFLGGRHNRGAAMVKEMEKFNEAVCRGWRILQCQPKDLCTLDFVITIQRALQPLKP